MARAKLVVASIAALALTACASLDHGTVVDKRFEPAHTTYINNCVLVGKMPVCTPVPIFVDDAWSIWVCDGDEFTEDRTCDWWEIPEVDWDAIEIGEKISKGES